MTPEDLREMRLRLNQEELLISHSFEPVLEGGRELFVRDLELFDRGRALVVSLEELVALDRGAPLFTNSLIRQRDDNLDDERGETV